MPIDIAVGSTLSVGGSLMPLLRWVLPPRVVFGSPVQRSKDESKSFWHIPIWIERRGRIGPGSLSRCQIFLDLYEGGKKTNAIRLEWGDAVFAATGETATLEVGERLLVPVVTRTEGNDGNAYVADSRHLKKGATPYPFAPDRRKHLFKLRLKVGKKNITSSHSYQFRVPAEKSNGFFTLEQVYEGEGTQ